MKIWNILIFTSLLFTMIPTEDITIDYLLTDDQPYIGGISRFQLFIKNNMDEPITYARINVTVIIAEDKSLLTQWSEEIFYIAPHDIQLAEMWFLWEYPQYIFQISVYADNVKSTELEFVLFITPNVMTVTETLTTITESYYFDPKMKVTETEYITTFTERYYYYTTTETSTVPEFHRDYGILFIGLLGIFLSAGLGLRKIHRQINRIDQTTLED